jgi:hypothetical protein
VDYLTNTSVGLRVSAGARQIDETEDGVRYDLDTQYLGLTPTFRSHIRASDSARIYGEAFVGYQHYWGDETISDGVTTAEGSGDDGGLVFGGGLGCELDMSKNQTLLIGVEWARLRVEGGDLDYFFDDASLVVGWSIKF